MEKMLKVGTIASTHGLKGEVKVYPATDAKRFLELEKISLDTGKEMRELTVSGVKFFKNLVILKLSEIDSIGDIEKYKGHDLWVSREEAQELGEDEYYIGDLIGMEVHLEDGSLFGYLTDVMETGANDVYVVKRISGEEILLPAIGDCILNVDVEKNVMTVHLLKGLVE